MAVVRPQISISVRDFALPFPRSGSIEADSGYAFSPERGLEIHAEIQAKRAAEDASYLAEQPLQHVFETAAFRFRVGGRVDGRCATVDGVCALEEIKSTFDDARLLKKLAAEPEHPYLLQLRTYGYFELLATKVEPRLKMLVVSSRRGTVTELDVGLDLPRYEAWLARRLEALVIEEKDLRSRARRRRKVGLSLQFPFATPRPGQLELVQFLEQPTKKHHLIQAPTGLGKTVAVSYPMLKEALARGSPLLYVTPKNSQQREAENAAAHLAKASRLKAITLTAKARLCMKDEPLCNPTYCEYARGHYDKVERHGLVAKLAKKPKLDEHVLRSYAKRYEVCPYELSLDAAPAFDLIIGDYNYVIQHPTFVGRIAAKLRGKGAAPNLVVDEAHNLVPRACDNLSAALSRRTLTLHAAKLDAQPEARRLALRLADLIPSIRKLRDCGKLQETAADLAAFFGQYLASDAAIEAGDPVVQLAQEVGNFVGALALATQAQDDGEDESFAFLAEGQILRLVCLDASAFLARAFLPFAKLTLFSATLAPFEYHARLAGLDSAALATAEFASPFPRENRKLLIIPQVSTKLRDRARHAQRIADAIRRITAVRPGHYAAFFPSFAFLAEVAAHLQTPGFEILRQAPAMTRAQTTATLARLRDTTHPAILLGVQGGSFAEGVDYPGEILVGVLIIGPGIPSADPAREAMRVYYEKRYGKGGDYAYTIPAMAKVVQAAGRVIRTESDRGIIVLLDARFLEPRYTALFPADWREAPASSLVSTAILAELAEFWKGSRNLADI